MGIVVNVMGVAMGVVEIAVSVMKIIMECDGNYREYRDDEHQ